MSADEALPASWRDLEQFAFGDSPEMAGELLALVLAGTKTATASALREYEAEGEPISRVGERWVVLDGQGRPACPIETCEVARRLDEVDETFAHDEGEGDRSLAFWRHEHARFFRRHGVFSEDMLLVCERFLGPGVRPAGSDPGSDPALRAPSLALKDLGLGDAGRRSRRSSQAGFGEARPHRGLFTMSKSAAPGGAGFPVRSGCWGLRPLRSRVTRRIVTPPGQVGRSLRAAARRDPS